MKARQHDEGQSHIREGACTFERTLAVRFESEGIQGSK